MDQAVYFVAQGEHQIDIHHYDEQIERAVVFGSDAIVDPRAMVIVHHNAGPAYVAVSRSGRLHYLAVVADTISFVLAHYLKQVLWARSLVLEATWVDAGCEHQ